MVIGVYLPRYSGRLQFFDYVWRYIMSKPKYSVSFVNGVSNYTIYRYDCGSYFLKLPTKKALVKTSASVLRRFCPDEFHMLRCKAGLRPYNVG